MRKKKEIIVEKLPTEAEIDTFEMLEKLLNSSYLEMKQFSNKKPDELLNKFKVKSINRILEPIKLVMRNEPTAAFLDLLDEDEIPSNSDAILIIAQFQAAMRQFKATYFGSTEQFSSARWFTKENPGIHYK